MPSPLLPSSKAGLCFLLWLSAAAAAAQAARLVVVPLAASSHIAAFTALTTALEHHGGHEIHMVVSDALLESSKAMAAARNASHRHSYLTCPLQYDMFPKDMAALAKAHFVQAMSIGYKVLAAMIDMVIGNRQLLQEVAALQPDLVIGDAVGLFGFWFTELTGVPSVEFDVGTSSGLLHSMYGGQFNPAYVPAPGTFYPSTGMTLKQRCVNTAATVAIRGMVLYQQHVGAMRQLADRHGVKHLPGTGRHRSLLLLVNFDWALEPPRPIGPSIKYLGALMPRPAQQLPDEYDAWLQDTPDMPVVFVSFGASFAAPEAAIPAVAKALAGAWQQMRFVISMKQPEQQLLKVTWKRLGQEPSQQQVLLQDWVPQNDLLGSGRLAAFVTQGGYLSMQEAAYHSVPVITVPLSLGQEEISQFAVDQGRGLLVRKETLLAGREQPLLDALRQLVVNNSAFKAQAQLVARRLRAHPRSPGQQAADWVAYALANPRGSGSFLHTQGQDMPVWQVLLLDVAVVTILGALAVALLLWCIRRSLWGQAGPAAHELQHWPVPEGPGTPSPPQSPVHTASHKAGKAE